MIQCLEKYASIKLSEHFSSDEFDCHCARRACNTTLVDTELIKKLEEKRELFKEPIIVMSGYRCPAHNRNVGGKPKSMHMRGLAADIKVKGIKPSKVADMCEDFNGVGRYPTFTHVDVRSYKARW